MNRRELFRSLSGVAALPVLLLVPRETAAVVGMDGGGKAVETVVFKIESDQKWFDAQVERAMLGLERRRL